MDGRLNINLLSEFKKFNAAEYTEIDQELYDELRKFFRPHNERLYKFLGRDFNWNY